MSESTYGSVRIERVISAGFVASKRFMRALTAKILHSGNILTSPLLLKQLSAAIQTDLSMRETIGFITQFSQAFKDHRVKTGSVPGAVNINIWCELLASRYCVDGYDYR